MKSIKINILLIVAVLFGVLGCKMNNALNLHVTPVNNLYLPKDDTYIQLKSSASASELFQWAPAQAADGGLVLYQVGFDTVGGNFANPIYMMPSDNNGEATQATITDKTLNKIASLAGIKSSDIGELTWTVFSSKGVNKVKGQKTYKLKVKRLSGFANPPTNVYITGAGSENGTNLSKAIQAKSTGSGEFEIYTKLTAGSPYYFVDGTSGTPRKFYISGGKIKENGTSTVSQTGVYRIKLDFTIGAASIVEVKNIGLWFSAYNKVMFNIPYQGDGVWEAQNQPIVFYTESWGTDARYKFRMSIDSAGTQKYEWWGSKNSNNPSRPTQSTPASFYYLYPVSSTQWDYTYKFQDQMDSSNVDIKILYQPGEHFTHEVIKESNIK